MTYAIFPEMPTGWNSKKTFGWETKVIKSASGKRKAMTSQAYPIVEIESSLVGLSDAQVSAVFGFLCQRKGQLEPFLWKDPEDYAVTDMQLAIGNNSTSEYQLVHWMGTFAMPVTDIVSGTLHAYINGVETAAITLLDGGVLKFTNAPQTGKVVTVSFEYYWRVAFADDGLTNEVVFTDINKISSLKLVTVR